MPAALPLGEQGPRYPRALQAYLGHKNIQHMVRHTELSGDRFKDLWRQSVLMNLLVLEDSDQMKIWRHESGTYLKLTHAGAALFA
jgi:hypothetical protein